MFNGAIYAPKAQLNIGGNAQTPLATSIVVQSVILTNSGGITVGSPLAITSPATLAAWTVGRTYPTASLTGTGGGGAYTWSATGLPAGMSIDPVSGDISGTPTAAGAPSVTVTLNDAAGDAAATKSYTLTINAAPTISTASPLPGGDQGTAYSRALNSSGGTASLAWSATGLPAGLSINPVTGAITGTPTAAGPSTVAVTAHRQRGRHRVEEPGDHDRGRTLDRDRVAAPGR